MCFRRWHEAWQRISGFWQEFECGYGRPTVSLLSADFPLLRYTWLDRAPSVRITSFIFWCLDYESN